jgi:prepilin-type N-terminal cleavage/methylation domain-containing protein
MKNKLKNAQGFSLTEIVIVVAVLALTVGFSVPMLDSAMDSMKTASKARNIATTLSYAKIGATSQMTRYQLSLDLNGNTWSLNKWDRENSVYVQEGIQNDIADDGACEVSFLSSVGSAPPGFSTQTSNSVTFNSRGLPVNGTNPSPEAVYLTDNDDQYAVTVSISGKVQLLRMEDGQWKEI